MGILYSIGEWRASRPIEREVSLVSPSKHQTIVWRLAGSEDVGVIEKIEGGRFLGFRVEKEKPFGRVVGQIKRRITIELRKEGK